MNKKDDAVIIIDDPAKIPEELRDTWDGKARRAFFRRWPPQKLLPDDEPAYVRSWLYIFGMCTLISLILLMGSGIILAIMGPEWYLNSYWGAVVEASHYWSVQLFFIFLSVHFLAVYFMGAFRGRALTWMLGVLCLVVAIGAGLTGYSILQDFESQWVTTQAKDAINSIGIGGFFNLLNTGQIMTLHIVVLPLLLVLGVIGHILAVRRRGICPPYDANEAHQAEVEE